MAGLLGVVRACVYLLETVIARVAEGTALKAGGTALHSTMDSRVLPMTPHGIHRLIPDWSSLRRSSDPQQASVMCALNYSRFGCPASGDLCPREALLNILRRAREAWHLEFFVRFEVEFLVMRSYPTTDRLVPHSRGLGHFAVSGLRDSCFRYGVVFDEVHTEGYRGQNEIALRQLPPVQAIDQLVLVHDTLKDVFSRHGYLVTMSPKPVASDWDVNGQHTHLSLRPARPGVEEHFLAGILKRLSSLCAFCLPQDISYKRLQPYRAGDSVCWGTESRLVPTRKIRPSYWESRCIDATANMYSAVAAILGAGLLGLECKEPLIWPDLGPSAKTLDAALDNLDLRSSGLDTMIGRPLVDHYIEMKRYETSRMREMDAQTVRELLVELF
ncbi:hypothetical protein BDW71DRAFT_200971 [Aspergillus fruticulosus]